MTFINDLFSGGRFRARIFISAILLSFFTVNCSNQTFQLSLDALIGNGAGQPNPSDALVLRDIVVIDNMHIIAEYDEPVQQDSAETLQNYSITYTDGANADKTLAVQSASLDPADYSHILITTESQSAGQLYRFQATNLVALDGSTIRGSSSKSFVGVDTQDITPPEIVAIDSLILKTTGSPDRVALEIRISEPVTANSPAYTMTPDPVSLISAPYPCGVWPDCFRPVPAAINNNTFRLEFDAATPFVAGDTHRVSLMNIADLSGNAISSDSFAFTVGPIDTTAPVITSATAVSAGVVTVTFSEEIATGLTNADFTIDNGIGNPNNISIAGSTVYLTLPAAKQLSSGVSYTLTAANATDLSGNVLAAGVGDSAVFLYSATDTTKPFVTGISSVSNAQVDVYYSEAVTAATAGKSANYVFGSGVSANGAITCTVSAPYSCSVPTTPQPDSIISLAISGVKDNAGNSLVPFTGTFQGDALPVVISVDSVITSAASDVPDTFIVHFSEPLSVSAGSPSATAGDYLVNGNTGFIQSVDTTHAGDSPQGYLIIGTDPQTEGTVYNLSFTAAANIVDLNGNALDTSETVPSVQGANGRPTVTNVTVASNGSTATANITFSEAMNSASPWDTASVTNPANYSIASCAACTVTGVTLTSANTVQVQFTGTPAGGAPIQVAVTNVADTAGYSISSGAPNFSSSNNYTPGDTTPPSVANVVSTGNKTLQVTFSEDVLADGSANAADNAANYSFNKLTISGITCSANICEITTSAQELISYTVTIPSNGNSIEDLNGQLLSSSSAFDWIGTPPPDTTPPTLVKATPLSENTLIASFSESVNPVSAQIPGNYFISPGVAVTGASLTSNPGEILLTTTQMTAGVTYTLTAVSIIDMAGNIIDSAMAQKQFKGINTSAPYVLYAAATSTTGVRVVFSEDIDPSTVDLLTFANYSVTTGGTPVTISGASLNANVLTLTTATNLISGITYTFSINNITDLYANKLGAPATATFDGSQVITISIADASVTETDTANTIISFKITVSPPSSAPISLNYQTAGQTALSDVDFISASGSLEIQPDQPSAAISVEVVGDGVVESDETFTVTITEPAAANQIGQSVATGTIINNDVPIDPNAPVIAFTDDIAAGPVNADTVVLTVTDANPNTTTFSYILTNSTACNPSLNFAGATAFTSGSPLSFTTEANNGNYICARASDFGGNTTYQISANPLNIDATAPAIVFTADTDAGPVAADSINITVTDTNPDTATYFYGFSPDAVCDGTDTYSAAYASGVSFNVNTETNNGATLCAKATDLAGNTAYAAGANPLNIDSTPPVIVFTLDVDAGPVTSDAITITVTDPNPDTATYAYAISADATCDANDLYSNAYTTGVSFLFSSEADNNNYLCAAATDLAGNKNYQVSANMLNIDVTPPVINSITSSTPNGSYGTGNSINLTLNFSEPVTLSGGTIDILLNNSRLVSINTAASATPSATYTISSGLAEAVNPLDINNITVSGTLSDNAGNAANVALPFGQNLANNSALIVGDVPTITSITSATANGSYKETGVIDITLNFSANVTLSSGTIDITLDTGATVSIPAFSNQNTASASYTIGAGQNSADLTVTSVTTSVANSLKDSLTLLNASTGLPAAANLADNSALVVDTTLPTVSITSAPTINNANVATYAVSGNCSEAATTVNIAVIGSSTVNTTATCNGSTYATAGFSVAAITDSTTLSVTADITDAAGNPATQAVQNNVIKDTANPTVSITSAPTINNANVATYAVSGNCSEAATTVNIAVIGSSTVNTTATCNGATYATAGFSVAAITDSTTLSVTADITDAAGNPATQAVQNNVIKDTSAPGISVTGPVNSAQVNHTRVSYSLSENFNTATITWTGTAGPDNGTVHAQTLAVADRTTGAHTDWLIASPPALVDGSTYTIDFDGADAAGNSAPTITRTGIMYDTTAPTNQNTLFTANLSVIGGTAVTIAASSANGGSAADAVWFAPAGLNTSTIAQFIADNQHTTTGGSSTSLAAPNNEGSYRLYVIDTAGNVSAQSTAILTVDNTAPTVTINQAQAGDPAGAQADPATVLPIHFTAVFSEPVNGFGAGNITQNGTATVNTWTVTDSGDSMTFTVSATSVAIAGGTIVPSIASNQVTDAAGNNNNVSSSTDNSVNYVTALTVTVNQSQAGDPAGAQADPINNPAVNFTVVFNSAIDPLTFTAADITDGGTATHGGWSIADSGDATTFTISATATSQGTLVPSLAASVVQDAAARNNDASTSTDNSVTYELVKPNVAINQSGGQADPANTNPVSFTVVFTEAIDPATFNVATDFTLGGTATYAMQNLSNPGADNINWTVEANVTGDGTVIPSLAAGVLTDLAGNTNNVSTATDNTVTFDTVAPTATVSGTPSGISGSTVLAVTVGGTGVINYQYALGLNLTCSGATYSADIPVATLITDDFSGLADGTMVLCVRGKDAAGNLQTAASATSATWTKDTTGAVATISGAPTGTNNTTVLGITIAGAGITEYKYAIGESATLDCTLAGSYTGGGAANGGIAVATQITDDISALADGVVKLCVVGFNGAWQLYTDATIATWTKLATAPTLIANGAETLDIDGNGKIDHMKLTFTSAVDATTFPNYNAGSPTATVDWFVGAYGNVTLDLTQGDTLTDEFIYLAFDENLNACNATDQTGCDTGVIPDLTTSVTPGLKDTIGTGNSVLQISSGTVAEKDSSAPVVVGADPPSNITLNVFLSENVTAATAECGTGSSQSGTACSSVYSLDGGLTVSKAIMAAGIGVSDNQVVLTTATQTQSQLYTLTVTSGIIKDVSNLTANAPNNTATFNGAAPTTNLISSTAIDNNTVELTFNVTVTAASAECASYAACDNGTGVLYSIPGLTITAANAYPTPGVDSATIRLTTSNQLSNTTNGYTITVTTGIVAATTGGLTCDSPNNTANFTGDTLPEVQSVASLNDREADVIFSENVLMDTSANGALLATNYCIEETATKTTNCTDATAIAVTNVTQLANNKVRLSTDPNIHTLDVPYTITVFNVWDSTAPSGNPVSSAANTGNFLGQENIKIISGSKVTDASSAFSVFKIAFSKPFTFDGGTNAVDTLTNWTFPTGLNTVTVCYDTDDAACPSAAAYAAGSATEIFFKASPEPAQGAYTVVAAASGVGNCILPIGGVAPGDCLKNNPDDRASIDFGLPVIITDGPVYTDPFNDTVTLSGQVIQYNGKLVIGPNDVDSGLFQTDINMQNATSIIFDADKTSPTTYEAFAPPLIESGTDTLNGIDYMFSGCYDSTGAANTRLTAAACTAAGGTEYLFVLGYKTGTATGYQSNWNTTDTVSPFAFDHITGLSNSATRTFRAMSIVIFKGWVYQASQHQTGSWAPRWDRFQPPMGAANGDMGGRFINRIGEGAWIPNGQAGQPNGLISIDYMLEYDNDDTGTGLSQLYLANGGSCSAGAPGSTDATCTSGGTRTTATMSDGGVARNFQTYSTSGNPPPNCTSTTQCNTIWEDVTPSSFKWRQFMSIPLPDDARAGGEWDNLIPANTITPAIKAIPKMVEFNGDLYMIRNACATETVIMNGTTPTFLANGSQVCTAGDERPQLWRLPKFTGTCLSALTGTVAVTANSDTVTGTGTLFLSELVVGDVINVGTQYGVVNAIAGNTSLTMTATWGTAVTAGTAMTGIMPYTDSASCTGAGFAWTAGTNGSNYANHWILVAEDGTTGVTNMKGASWIDGVAQNQTVKAAGNTHATLLEVNGSRLYIGFDNASYGANIWRSKAGVTNPATETDFEAVCENGNACWDPTWQFGLGQTTSNSRIFDSISVNDAGTDYLILNTGDGVNPMKIYRTTNN